MTVPKKKWTKERVIEHFEEGRGHGTHADYRPWQTVREFNSWGNQTRLPSLIFERPIQTFSNLEADMYRWLEFGWTRAFGSRGKRRRAMRKAKVHKLKPIQDFREQFPLDSNVTVKEAEVRGISHPRFPLTNLPTVMTIDGLVVRGHNDNDQELEMWDAKPASRRVHKRTLDKLSLHTAYCERLGIKHYIFDERTASKRVLRHIELIRGAMPNPYEELEPADLFTAHLNGVKSLFPTTSRVSVSSLCTRYDEARSLPDGSALRLLWCLVWTRQLEMDLDVEELEQTPSSDVVLPEGD